MLRRRWHRGRSAEEICLPPICLRPTRHFLAFPAWLGAKVALQVRWLYLIKDGYVGPDAAQPGYLADQGYTTGPGRRTNPLSREWCFRRLTACGVG